MSGSLISRSQPVLFEGVIVILLGLFIIYNLTVTDISFHGNYVGFLIEKCHPKNHEKLCDEFREHLKVSNDAQMELGDPYWQDLARQSFFIGLTMFFIRVSFIWILHKSHVQKIRPSSVLMAFLYGVVGYGLFVGGLLDTLYFVLQGQLIPTNLDWLDHAGLFEYTKGWDGDPSHVSSTDLYLTNFTMVLIIGSVLVLTMIFFKESNVKRGIA